MRDETIRGMQRLVRTLLLIGMLSAAALAQPPKYTVQFLPPLPGYYPLVQGAGLNNQGQVAGGTFTTTFQTGHAWRWNGSTIIDLGAILGGNGSQANSINSSGVVAGWSYFAGNNGQHAVYWDGSVHDIDPDPHANSQAHGINAAGHIVGLRSSGGFAAFLWNGTSIQSLGDLGGGFGWARAINDYDQVTGFGNTAYPNSQSHAFLWDGAMHDLGTLPGGAFSDGKAINNRGQVVGLCGVSTGRYHACLWDGSAWKDLGTLPVSTPGFDYSAATGINNLGQVVGWSYTDVRGFIEAHTFLWDGTKMYDVDSLLKVPNSASTSQAEAKINDNGQILSGNLLLSPAPGDTTPPVIVPSVSGTAGANGWYTSSVNLTWQVGDPESGIASSSGCGPVTLTATSTTVTCSATNGAGLTSSASQSVQIDTAPPAIAGMPVSCSLWPPNGKMVQVAIVGASDAISGMAAFNVTGVSNEPQDPKNPDIVISGSGLGPRTVQLRADRLGTGAGRIYTLTATAIDVAGNQVTSVASCVVPHDQGH